MSRLAPVLLAVGAAVVAITTALASAHGAFTGRVSLVRYICAYAVAAFLFFVAGILYYKQDRPKPRIIPLRYGAFTEGIRSINGRWHKADGTPFTVEESVIKRNVGKHGLFVKS